MSVLEKLCEEIKKKISYNSGQHYSDTCELLDFEAEQLVHICQLQAEALNEALNSLQNGEEFKDEDEMIDAGMTAIDALRAGIAKCEEIAGGE